MRNASCDRRTFLRIGGGAVSALILGFNARHSAAGRSVFAPNAWLRIGSDDSVTVIVNKSEMGQGVHTALAMLVAEELECEWSAIRIEMAPVTPKYADSRMGEYRTDGSTSMVTGWTSFREAGAAARIMLVNAAARRWNVDAEGLRARDGRVHHPASGRSAGFGELASDAGGMEIPDRVPLKPPSEFRVVGTNVPRLEGRAKVTGQAEFGLDVRLPGMLRAMVLRPPVRGAKIKTLSTAAAHAVPGVVKIKRVSTGVAVIARDAHAARTGRDALRATWADGPRGRLSTDLLRRAYRARLERPGLLVEDRGDAAATMRSAAKQLDAVYEVPYLAHAPMEPLNAVAHVTPTACHVWTGTQYQSMDQTVAAALTGLRPEQVHIHTTLLGGGFGRRATPAADFVAEAVEIARGEGAPVQTIWTREDDVRGGYYRPMFVHRVRAGLDRSGAPVAWQQRIVGQSVARGTRLEAAMMAHGVDMASVLGTQLPYAIDHRRIDCHNAPASLTVSFWRSVGHSHTAFVAESFLDEIAHTSGRDPLSLRRELLRGEHRHLAVLDLAAEKSGWHSPPPRGRARGIAIRQAFGTFVAEVAEVSLDDTGEIRVHRVTCAVDCGLAINPWNVEAQIESAVVYGLSAALHGEITLERGRVRESNFHDYPVLRIDRMPEIAVHIVRSEAPPTGVGEAGVPPIAPAVANALFVLTGRRIRRLPLQSNLRV